MSICSICGESINHEYPAKCLTCGSVLCDECAIKNSFKCEECTGGATYKPKFKTVRRSFLELYKKCPYAFGKKIDEEIETKNNVYAEIGIKLHNIFDRESNIGLGKSETKEQFVARLISEYNEWFDTIPLGEFDGCQEKLTTKDFKEHMRQVGHTNIEGFWDVTIDMPMPWKTELTFENFIEDTELGYTSTFDRINLNEDGTYDLLDYKTGKTYVGKKLQEDLQPALYINNVEKNLGIKIKRFIFLFTGEGKERTFTRISSDKFECIVRGRKYVFSISDKLAETKVILDNIAKGFRDIPANVNTWYCKNQCEIYKVNQCAGSMLEKWK